MGDFVSDLNLKRTAREDKDYIIVSNAVWNILIDSYGSLCAIPRVSVQVPTEDPMKKDFLVEVHLRRFELRTSPGVRYHEMRKMPHRFYVSRASTVKEMHLRICE